MQRIIGSEMIFPDPGSDIFDKQIYTGDAILHLKVVKLVADYIHTHYLGKNLLYGRIQNRFSLI